MAWQGQGEGGQNGHIFNDIIFMFRKYATFNFNNIIFVNFIGNLKTVKEGVKCIIRAAHKVKCISFYYFFQPISNFCCFIKFIESYNLCIEHFM